MANHFACGHPFAEECPDDFVISRKMGVFSSQPTNSSNLDRHCGGLAHCPVCRDNRLAEAQPSGE